ncbi:SusD/RagB family nutrient-binding outer membrane lipoprotein [Sphingobacterium oryzagri]|uniref:SusD/RagB family nutrient-binding outer membrane lipoprotein n=1 Tax=Sphingobacterium oryzagri TaxID=3025669 RepID=A0ABY7WEY3_9SPHI|nr:SusD/RagB family nutrient-binding outer membrane lipoprotein [Sphingobacterium sp. KACC 22765]WDF68196.1 SusD/RagB family nutrient-binding outer membrane lipoprotein [Sphingobacterium sp. KACC 22765]
MKRKYIIGAFLVALTTFNSCQKEAFDESYRDPSKVVSTTVERQFTGVIYGFRQLMVPDYRNYFVTVMPTIARYTQINGWANGENQLTPGAAAIEDRWNRYYEGLAQFRELEKVFNASDAIVQENTKVFMLTAKVLFYDQTQQIVDLHGSIPWSQAGKLSTNGGDYPVSYAAYDAAEQIYTTMLDDLKSISTELNGITVPANSVFRTQDLINKGDLNLWKKYCNSLRVRLLTRVSASSAFSSRAQSELAEIVGNPATYPLILTNADNAQLDVADPSSPISSTGFQDALESWNGNIASKVMIDNMLQNQDPRLPFIFEPGAGANGEYIGLDQSLTGSVQSAMIAGTAANPSRIAIYNRSTFSRNDFFPGVLISASEVNYLLAEYYARRGDNATAKTYFQNGIKQSVSLFVAIRQVSNDVLVPAATTPTDAAVNAYLSRIGWESVSNKIQLIATQKWLHFNMMQPVENWAEVRRLDSPTFQFVVQSSDLQRVVPVKWNIPPGEVTFNSANYSTVRDQDNVNTKLFWDVN